MKNIILTGFMGAGKTATANIIAARSHHYTLIDTDAWIEEKTGITIPDIFAQYGESHFRKLEEETAQELSHMNGLVIATGGGFVINSENYYALSRSGMIVFLDVPFDEIMRRIADTPGRPLLSKARELYEKRYPIYCEHCHVRVEGIASVEEIAEVLLGLL